MRSFRETAFLGLIAFDISESHLDPPDTKIDVCVRLRDRQIDSFSRAVLNAQMQRNRHRWKLSVSDHAKNVLEGLAKRVKWAWEIDKKDPKSYPLNTDYVFGEIDEQLSKFLRDRSQIEPQARKLPLPPRPPMRFSDLVDEKIIKAVYEQQNDGSYEDALKLAASGKGKGASAWRKIVLAVDASYMIDFCGMEFIPRPRVQFLHRKLLNIAERVGLNDISHEGIAEFLDDLCPCEEKHKSGTIRKLRKRWSGTARTKK